ncbi:hypothetical protein L1887_22391 [Cichorium endivia]|nr:hypothetical protein L1887_22391 [Cichorium endivia]
MRTQAYPDEIFVIVEEGSLVGEEGVTRMGVAMKRMQSGNLHGDERWKRATFLMENVNFQLGLLFHSGKAEMPPTGVEIYARLHTKKFPQEFITPKGWEI